MYIIKPRAVWVRVAIDRPRSHCKQFVTTSALLNESPKLTKSTALFRTDKTKKKISPSLKLMLLNY